MNIKFNLTVMFSFVFLCSCDSEERLMLLQEIKSPELEIINYLGDIYHGNFISVIKRDENSAVRYNIEVDDNGKILHVNKNENEFFSQEEKKLEMFRGLQLLGLGDLIQPMCLVGLNMFFDPSCSYEAIWNFSKLQKPSQNL